MKKVIKFAGYIVLAIVVILAIGAVTIQVKGIPTYEKTTLQYQHQPSSEKLIRGKKLATMLCAGCHMDPDTGKLTGKKMFDAPPEFGDIYAPNITGDKEYGIGDWTDAEIVYLLRTGIKRDGSYAPPYMAKLPKIADDDLDAIITFLRSDDELVEPDAKPDRPSNPSFLTKLLTNTAFKPFPMPDEPIALPDTTNMIELGEYLAINLDCFSCHSADFTTNDYLNPEESDGFFGGGNKPLDLEGNVILTSNLTPHPVTGIGNWSEEKFVNALRYGIKEGEPALRYPMQPYVHLTNYEAKAIFAYLKTVPPSIIELKDHRLSNEFCAIRKRMVWVVVFTNLYGIRV